MHDRADSRLQPVTLSAETTSATLMSLSYNFHSGAGDNGHIFQITDNIDSSLGRFMTPDWAAKPTTVPYAKFGDPQSLNLYAFVENSPIDRIDADGHVTSADFRCPDQRHCVDQSPLAGSCDNTVGSCYTGEWSSDYNLWLGQQAAQNTTQTQTQSSQQ